ncbi:MAG: lyase family protein [Candidatus Micrarchaeia archaeon]
MGKRIEKDAIGSVEVPEGAYYGSFTSRAAGNFPFAKSRGASELYRSYAIVKLASARANCKSGVLAAKKAGAIEKAANELLAGKFDSQLPLGFYQAGAGTPFNMNVNEVLANRANEILGGGLGSYEHVHPNNDVNMGQSSNDVTPAAIRITLLRLSPSLEAEIENLCRTLDAKAAKYKGKIKVGRTHLQDAVPIGIDQEILAWSGALGEDLGQIREAKKLLCAMPLGGTALGTGIASHPQFAENVAGELSSITGERITSGKNKPMLISSMNHFLAYSSALRSAAVTLVKISCDLKLLVSGPRAGIAEVQMPEVEPGSSIMPGKINPSMPEALEIIALDAISSDSAVLHACLGGQMQLNVLTPLIAKNTIEPVLDLAGAIAMFDKYCAKGLEYDLAASQRQVDASYIFATALNPYLGYQAVAGLVKESLQTGKSVRDVALLHKLMEKKDIDAILSPGRLTSPAPIDGALSEKVKKTAAYREYLSRIGK